MKKIDYFIFTAFFLASHFNFCIGQHTLPIMLFDEVLLKGSENAAFVSNYLPPSIIGLSSSKKIVADQLYFDLINIGIRGAAVERFKKIDAQKVNNKKTTITAIEEALKNLKTSFENLSNHISDNKKSIFGFQEAHKEFVTFYVAYVEKTEKILNEKVTAINNSQADAGTDEPDKKRQRTA
jgi:hypothetical protein